MLPSWQDIADQIKSTAVGRSIRFVVNEVPNPPFVLTASVTANVQKLLTKRMRIRVTRDGTTLTITRTA